MLLWFNIQSTTHCLLLYCQSSQSGQHLQHILWSQLNSTTVRNDCLFISWFSHAHLPTPVKVKILYWFFKPNLEDQFLHEFYFSQGLNCSTICGIGYKCSATHSHPENCQRDTVLSELGTFSVSGFISTSYCLMPNVQKEFLLVMKNFILPIAHRF